MQSYDNSGVQRTGSTLTLEGVQLTDSGNYSCVASNLYGTMSSDAAQLSVNGTYYSSVRKLFPRTSEELNEATRIFLFSNKLCN